MRYKITLKGLNLDTFIDKSYKEKIKFFSLSRPYHNEINFVVSKQDFNKIKLFTSQYNLEKEELGTGKLRKFFMSSLTVWIMLPFIVLLGIFAQTFVWKIEINGLVDISQSEILTILENNDIKIGKKCKTSMKNIEKQLLKNSQIAQCSCYLRGTTIIINISEKLVYKPSEFSPLKAKNAGIIKEYVLYQGTINFKIGDFVNKGDILVFPYILDKDGNQVAVEPKAKIKAIVNISKTLKLAKTEQVLARSGKSFTKTKLGLNLDKKSYTNNTKPFVFFEYFVYNSNVSKILPIIKQTIVYYELIIETKSNDLESNKSVLEEQCKQELLSEFENENIQNLNSYTIIINDVLYATTQLTFVGDLA